MYMMQWCQKASSLWFIWLYSLLFIWLARVDSLSPKLISPTHGSTWNRAWNDGTSPCLAADGRTCRIPPMRLLPCLGIWGIQPFVCSSYILDNQLLMLNRLCHMDQVIFDNTLIDRCLWITFLNLFYHSLGSTYNFGCFISCPPELTISWTEVDFVTVYPRNAVFSWTERHKACGADPLV